MGSVAGNQIFEIVDFVHRLEARIDALEQGRKLEDSIKDWKPRFTIADRDAKIKGLEAELEAQRAHYQGELEKARKQISYLEGKGRQDLNTQAKEYNELLKRDHHQIKELEEEKAKLEAWVLDLDSKVLKLNGKEPLKPGTEKPRKWYTGDIASYFDPNGDYLGEVVIVRETPEKDIYLSVVIEDGRVSRPPGENSSIGNRLHLYHTLLREPQRFGFKGFRNG